MAIDLTTEQKELGRTNFQRVVGRHYELSRRDFMKGLLTAGTVLPISAAVYFGYQKLHGNPVKAGLIGAGDEGGVLVGEHNPEYLQFIAGCDIRPTNRERIFVGETNSPRKGFNRIYGNDARKNIQMYDDYHKLLENKDIEAVVIALPLHLHAQAAIDAMKAGKHVLCEKLMAWNIAQCKEMIRVADETDRILSIGHQRHYSMLYAHAVEVLKTGDLGDIRHIRALWHRNNALPRLDKEGKEMVDPTDPNHRPFLKDSWYPEIPADDRKALEPQIRQLGYKSMEELVRWRLFNRTGGGLMAELGSHQIDACTIFLGKVHPLAVSGFGGKIFYHDEREVDDHVFVTFEFPGPGYFNDKEKRAVKDKNDRVVVTYSSISTNAFEPYGECVMGNHGTMIVSQESDIMLYPHGPAGGRATAVTVSKEGKGLTVLDASASTGLAEQKAVDAGKESIGKSPVSRGYREEMEDFAYCVRMWNQADKKDRRLPRCHGRVAMADAIIALTSNQAMHKKERIEFKPEWFDSASPDVPDPDMKPEIVTA